ncbi:MAG: TetR/AcrR family transcriptional regulator [Pseudorhodoplanes sp.]
MSVWSSLLNICSICQPAGSEAAQCSAGRILVRSVPGKRPGPREANGIVAKKRKAPVRLAKRSTTRSAKRVRLNPEARSDQILRGAIRFFAERGFGGQTRDLAKQLGISTGLLFRYFPSKDVLIDRIYESLFEGRWKDEWDEILGNRSRDLKERLIEFYLDYSKMLHDYEWGRIYLYSGLGGAGIAPRFVKLVTNRVYTRVIGELRRAFGQPDIETVPLTEPEIELMWSLHGSLFYIGIRKWVYDVGGPTDVSGTITQIVDGFYVNARELMTRQPRVQGVQATVNEKGRRRSGGLLDR